MRKSSNKYKVLRVIGSGTFAKVIAVQAADGTEYAVKKPFHKKSNAKHHSGIINMKELYIMTNIDHPYILSTESVYFKDPIPQDGCYLESISQYDNIFFIMPKADYSLRDVIESRKTPIYHMKRMMYHIASAVHHLHSQNIAHRDIKPGNILCFYHNGVPNAKICDFGTTKPLSNVTPNSIHAGTPQYRAPEIMLGNEDYGFGADIWSMACTFYQMASAKIAFEADTDIMILSHIFKSRGNPNKDLMRRICKKGATWNFKAKDKWISIQHNMKLDRNEKMLFDMPVIKDVPNPGKFSDFINLLDAMFEIDPEKRLTSEQVLNHKFFDGYREIQIINENVIQENYPVKYLPVGHPLWNIGANEIIDADLSTTDTVDYHTEYAIRIHGLDLYNRFLNYIKPLDDQREYKMYARVCLYIIGKYFLDEISPTIYHMYSGAWKEIRTEEIVSKEIIVLKAINFQIFELTAFSLIKEKSHYEVLLALLINSKVLYGKSVDIIAKIFDEEVSKEV